MSSEEEATAANVLSQMSQIQQSNLSPCETIETSVVVGHHCDVETSGIPVDGSQQEPTTTVEVTADVLQQVQAAFHTQEQQIQEDYVEVTQPSCQNHRTMSDDMCNDCQTCTGGKSYTCEHCGKRFNKSYNLKTHLRVHTGERPYQCEVCGHGFANLGDLKRHSRTHTGEKPFKCEYCEKVFSDFGSHKRHIRLHTGYKPFKCEQCDREFTRLDSYKNHIRLHTGDRPYKCETCGKQFNYLTTYKRHLNIHKGEKPYACNLCDKKFTRQNYLKNHLNTHTRNNECQTDLSVLQGSPTSQELEGMESSEEQTATENLNRVEDLDGGNNADGTEKQSESPSKSSEAKPHDASLLHQVTQVLGEIVPHNISAEVTDGAGGPQIVVQGADQTGGEFKITLAQQLLIAQHLLNQAQMRTGDSATVTSQDGEQTITAVTIPDITPELAEQIVNQANLQHTSHNPDEIQVIELSNHTTPSTTTITTSSQEIFVGGQLVTVQSSDVTERVIEQSHVTSEAESSINQGDSVYVAIDPSQPEVQEILGQIQLSQENTADVVVTQSETHT
ncbi:oocyte zinc finger protein XlCOF28 [Nematostella vectensis]|uniref:oocyte zinc finger protein XlCOF28 n=1 Tax=Nematostella vectensis TaxID=45351 RepID=UPI0013903E35|nr:oocyte zinc finger protein XlCOF28 [Nematostella vectensis]